MPPPLAQLPASGMRDISGQQDLDVFILFGSLAIKWPHSIRKKVTDDMLRLARGALDT
jgi:hypothetical protein